MFTLHNAQSNSSGFVQKDELVQKRCNSIANTLELHVSCTNPSIYPPPYVCLEILSQLFLTALALQILPLVMAVNIIIISLHAILHV